MFAGIVAGITWAIETIVLGIALAMSPFCSTEQAIFLAPFVSTFLHDACSAIWATAYNGVRGNLKNVWKAFFPYKTGFQIKDIIFLPGLYCKIGLSCIMVIKNYDPAEVEGVISI